MKKAKHHILLISLFCVLVILVAIRLALPSILLKIVNERLNRMPGYVSKVESISVSLYRGSYQINGVTINELNKNIPVPFFAAKQIDLSVEWSALFKGKFVAKITAYQPTINFVTEPSGKNQQLSIDAKWRRIVSSLFPLNINQVTVNDGSVHYRSFTSTPKYDLFFKNIDGTLTNLSNVKTENTVLPSMLKVQAQTMDGAPASLKINFNPFANQPEFYFSGAINDMDIVDTNNFLQSYTKLRVQRGAFSIYVEAAAKKGMISGYAKPIFKNLQIANDKTANPIKVIYQTAVKATAAILKNNKTNAVATKINIKGNVSDPSTSTLSIIGYLLRNAFIQALLPGIDHSVKMQDVNADNYKS